MSILPLASAAAATNVAQRAVAGSAQVGKSFLNLLSSWVTPDSNAAVEQSKDSRSIVEEGGSLQQRTESFAQRLTKWLREQPWMNEPAQSHEALSIELSLDSLDRPQATLAGQPSSDLNAALAQEPGWLDEFRQLALDRIEQQASFDTTSPPLSLTIQQQSATMSAVHRWASQ